MKIAEQVGTTMTSYWDRALSRRITRRRVLVAAATTVTTAGLAACGGDDVRPGAPNSAATAVAAAPTQAPATPAVGGKLAWQGFGPVGESLDMVRGPTNLTNLAQLAGLTHDALLDFAYGTPGYPGIGNAVLPSLAVALPELSPDKLTLTFKLRPARFQNGRDLVSEDVKWTYDTLAFEESIRRPLYAWLDSTEAPDPSTFVMRFRAPDADVPQSLAYWSSGGAILAREHQEGPDAATSLMGSGPYILVEHNHPTVERLERNPDYVTDPGKPYFDAIERTASADETKRLAEFLGRQVDVTYWFRSSLADEIRTRRQDVQAFEYPRAGAGNVWIRNDVAPFNDKRVRQAMSMGYDRQLQIDAVSEGHGEPDQALTRTGEAWEFRGPEDLPRSDLYELNVTEAKRLLAAANVTEPIKASIPSWNANVIGQGFVDDIVGITTQWRNHQLLDVTVQEEPLNADRFQGFFDTMWWGPNTWAAQPNLGAALRNIYWSAPEGLTAPTFNLTRVNLPELSDLALRQAQEFDRTARISLFRGMEEILSEEMVQCSSVTGYFTYFLDASVKNAQMPRDAFNGSCAWMKHWYFG